MLLFLKRLLLVLAAALLTQTSFGFALLGPRDNWQINALGYDPQADFGDLGGPKNLGEEWRWNIPTISYAFDQSFINYFGTNGMNAVEDAIFLFNREMVNLSGLTTAQLKAKPLNTKRLHTTAQSLGLLDLKSETMGLLAEQLGLAGAERWTWAIRDRRVFNANFTNYLVVKRNFDPFNYKPTNYVNGNKYTYQITFFPLRFFAADFEDAVEIPVDQAGTIMGGAVSSMVGEDLTGFGLRSGEYFSALTQDDVGGLKYIYQANNVNTEDLPISGRDVSPPVTRVIDTNAITFIPGVDAFTFFTNAAFLNSSNLLALYPDLILLRTNATPIEIVTTNVVITNLVSNGLFTNRSLLTLITNLDLYQFSEASRTNPANFLRGLYPPLVITRTNSTVVQEITPIMVLTNSPYGSPGDPPVLVIAGYVTNLVANYDYEYANVITNYASAVTDLELRDITRAPWSTPNELIFQTNVTRFRTNKTSGGFYILDRSTNINLVAYSLTDEFNNPLLRTTNISAGTNLILFRATNTFTGVLINRRDMVNTFTNVVYAAYPVFINGSLGDVLVTTLSTNPAVRFDYVFDPNNLLFFPPGNGNTNAFLQTTTFFPPSPPVTTITPVDLGFPQGTVLILDTNRFVLARNQFGQLIKVESFGLATNTIIAFTNAATGAFITEQLIYQTNFVQFAVYPIVLVASTGPLLRPGVDSLQFVRHRFNDFLSQSNAIATNLYAMTAITNGVSYFQSIQRVAGPDILFAAADIGTTTAAFPVSYQRIVNFQLGGAAAPALVDGGPGLIAPGATITFNKLSPTLFDQSPGFLGEESAFIALAWGSFDSKTLTPRVYPEDITGQLTTLQQLEAFALGQRR